MTGMGSTNGILRWLPGCVESDVNIMSGANVVQNGNEKSQLIDRQLRFYSVCPGQDKL